MLVSESRLSWKQHKKKIKLLHKAFLSSPVICSSGISWSRGASVNLWDSGSPCSFVLVLGFLPPPDDPAGTRPTAQLHVVSYAFVLSWSFRLCSLLPLLNKFLIPLFCIAHDCTVFIVASPSYLFPAYFSDIFFLIYILIYLSFFLYLKQNL